MFAIDLTSLCVTIILMLLTTLASGRIRKAIVSSLKDVVLIIVVTYAIGMTVTFLCPRCYLSQVQDLYIKTTSSFIAYIILSLTVTVAGTALITRYLCAGDQSISMSADADHCIRETSALGNDFKSTENRLLPSRTVLFGSHHH